MMILRLARSGGASNPIDVLEAFPTRFILVSQATNGTAVRSTWIKENGMQTVIARPLEGYTVGKPLSGNEMSCTVGPLYFIYTE